MLSTKLVFDFGDVANWRSSVHFPITFVEEPPESGAGGRSTSATALAVIDLAYSL